MKKYLLYAAAIIVFAGCSVEPMEKCLTSNSDEHIVTVKATIEGFENDTKTSYTLDTENSKALVSWSAGDAISVLYSNGSGGSYTQEPFTTAEGDGIFSGGASTTEGGKYAKFAIYPYNICNSIWPDNTNLREQFQVTLPDHINGSGADAIPMVAHTLTASWDETYHFKHLSSVIRFSFTNIPSNARQLVISHASAELAGLFYIAFDEGVPYLNEGASEDGYQRSMTYDFTPDAGAFTFYLPYRVGVTPSGNFTFTFKNVAGEVICARTTTLGTLASTTLARNTMYRVNIDALTFDGHPDVKSLVITPSVVPATKNNTFTIDGKELYAYEVFKENATNIKFNGTEDSKIYNNTSLGRIIKVVVEKDSCTEGYDGTYYTLYAGTTSNPSSEISRSEYVYNNFAVYSLMGGNYSYFSFMNNKAWGNRVGKITVYYKPS